MKAKKFLALFLSLVMALSCMSFTAFADGDEITVTESEDPVVWSSGNYVVNDSYVSLSGGVTVTGNVTLTINANCSLIIKGSMGNLRGDIAPSVGLTIDADSTLTVKGSGYLSITGGNGGCGRDPDEDYSTTGQNGATGVIANGTLSVGEITLEIAGGNGGSGYFTGGNGGNSGVGFVGTMIMTSGKLSLNSAEGGPSYGENYTDGTSSALYNFSQGTSFSGGLFNEAISDYVADGYFCVANTDSATNSFYSYMVVSGTYLDLESSTTNIPQSTTVNQTYTLTQTGDTTYTDVTKVRVSWVLPEISASYTLNKTWNPDTLSWDEAKTTATISEKKATFTFTNLSSVAVGATVSFKKSIVANSESVAVSDVLTLKSIVNPDTHIQQYDAAPSGTITHKYTPTASEFNSLADGSGTYGVYTVSLVSAVKVTFDMNGHGNAIDAQYVGIGGKITAPTAPTADAYTFVGWYTDAECNNEWNFTTGTVSEAKTLYAKWAEQ